MTTRTAQAATQIHDVGTQLRAAERALGRQDYRTATLDLDAAALHASLALVTTVRAWRATGATWQEIGDALGITRQAAWERFSTTARQ